MSTKCAIYLRVSSDIQDYERQISDLKKFAKDSNYALTDKNIYEDKLSGFKNEKEREGLNRLLKDVVNAHIKVLLVWEISRLARKHKDLLDITEFFQENGVNVYFYQQRFWLLDETGKVSPQAGLSIAFFGWHGEYEARLTKERFISAKKHNEAIGKYNGGKITFGYTLDAENRYIINKKPIAGLRVSESEIVKEVFDLYESGLTCSKICRICRSKGYPKMVCNTHTLARVLRDTSYIGYKNVKLGKRPLPILISNAQFLNVKSLIDSNKTKADKGKRHVYLLRGIIKCSYCNSYYVGKQTDDSYICPKNSGSNKTNKGTNCKGGNISVSNIDGIVWTLVKSIVLTRKSEGFDDYFEGNKIEINELKAQISGYKKLLNKLEQNRKKANIMFQNDGYTIIEYQKAIKGINNEKNECEKAIALIESQIRYYEKVFKESQTTAKRLTKIASITDRNQIKSIIKGLVKEIIFYKITTFKTVVFIQYLTGYFDWLIYNSVAKKESTFRLLNANYIRYDQIHGKFFVLRDIHNLNYWHLKTDSGINGGVSVKPTTHLRDPINPLPDISNSDVYDFDGLMKLPNILFVLETNKYSKLTYFKELNETRFNRKKLKQ